MMPTPLLGPVFSARARAGFSLAGSGGRPVDFTSCRGFAAETPSPDTWALNLDMLVTLFAIESNRDPEMGAIRTGTRAETKSAYRRSLDVILRLFYLFRQGPTGRGMTGDQNKAQDNVPQNQSEAQANDPAPGTLRPNPAQWRYLARGLSQAGGKLPLFDENGQQIHPALVRACITHGWAEPWFANPLKPGWLVCKLTEKGRRVLSEM